MYENKTCCTRYFSPVRTCSMRTASHDKLIHTHFIYTRTRITLSEVGNATLCSRNVPCNYRKLLHFSPSFFLVNSTFSHQPYAHHFFIRGSDRRSYDKFQNFHTKVDDVMTKCCGECMTGEDMSCSPFGWAPTTHFSISINNSWSA